MDSNILSHDSVQSGSLANIVSLEIPSSKLIKNYNKSIQGTGEFVPVCHKMVHKEVKVQFLSFLNFAHDGGGW
jgi:hypothetical protein